ncbi:MAG: CAP domain-containing protein, partial [Deltaproteobacteria bacterium]|nr:CAP domain-containing protein [Deltaproteobacteria bacterium]
EGLTAGERLKPFYSGPIYGWAENIWEGSNLSPADREALARRIMDAWMSSPGHRQNILNPDYTHLGVGVAASGAEISATQLFATLRRHRQAF